MGEYTPDSGGNGGLPPYRDGFNMKAVWAALFIGLIMLPGGIYLALLTGQGIGGAVPWVTLILFLEVARRSFVKLTPQEIQVVFWIAGGMMAGGAVMGIAAVTLPGGVFGHLIWEQFYVQSQQAQEFGLDRQVPRWIAPPPGSEALLQRNLFHRDWLLPIAIVLGHQVLYRLNWLGLGYLVFRQTSDIERLPFPLAPVGAEGILAVAESTERKGSWRWRVFSVGAILGAAYGLVYVVVPALTGTILSRPIEILPIPFFDFTAHVGDFMPGAILGVATDLAYVLLGMVLPFWVVVGTAAGSFLSRVVGNPLLYRFGLLETMGRVGHWAPGMTAVPAFYTSTLDFWLSVTIGLAITVAAVSLAGAFRAQRAAREQDPFAERPSRERGDLPIWVAVALYMGSTLAYIVLVHYLVPDFSVWLLIAFGFILTPLLSYISGRMYGITGVGGGDVGGVTFPMVREASFIFSGYQGSRIWFAPIPYFDHGEMAQRFKVLTLTRTRFTSIFKAELAIFLILALFSYLFWGLIWKMEAIPSGTFAYVQKFWPTHALVRSLWIDSTVSGGQAWIRETLDPTLIAGSTAAGFATFGLVRLMGIPGAFFYALVGGISGVFPHMAISMLLGAVLRRRVFEPRFGAERWASMAPLLLAGYGCGMGLVAMIAISISLIQKAVVQLPF